MLNRVNSFSGFQPLREVWLGDCYPAEFYNHLPADVQDAFALITEWTKQDLTKIETTLASLGVKVQRPQFTRNVGDYIVDDILMKPPICPRDTDMAFGNTFYHLRMNYQHNPWQAQIDDFTAHGTNVIQETQGGASCLGPPSIVRVGRDVYVDYDTHQAVWGEVLPTLASWAQTQRVHICQTNGHSDGVFCPVAPGLIVANHWLSIYDKTFPNWEIYHLPKGQPDNNWFGQWYVNNPTIMHNKGFAQHVEQHAQNWVGNFKETVFETNMLVVDQHNILAIKEDPPLFRWLEKQGFHITLCDFRCRSFWDGGLHCLTVDIARDGGEQDYFPSRPQQGYLDWL
jgi:hypothetical protein